MEDAKLTNCYVLMCKNFCGWSTPVGVYLERSMAEVAMGYAKGEEKRLRNSYTFFINEVPLGNYNLKMPGL
jgi:hypothetical protein